jgi:hypothetical protein
MSKAGALRGALGGLYSHNAAESKKAREETRVFKMMKESDRQFLQQVRRLRPPTYPTRCPLGDCDSFADQQRRKPAVEDYWEGVQDYARRCSVLQMRFWSLLETHFHCRHAFCENGTSLMPWAGQEGCLIDRYDGRALLDVLPPPPSSCSLPPDDELLLERRVTVRATACCRSHSLSFLNYERFRDLGALPLPA